MYIHERGNVNGPVILFLHGGGVSSWMWEKQVEYFSAYHCIIPDLPGHGRSYEETDFSMKQCARELIRVMDEAMAGRKISIIGFSLGAQLAIEILGQRREGIEYAIINSALVRPMPKMKRLIKPSIKLMAPLMGNRTFAKLQAKELYVGDEDFERYFAESKTMKTESLIRILEKNMTYQIPKGFAHSTAKILATAGSAEKKIMKKSLNELVKSHPECTGILIPGAGHGLSMSDPDRFNSICEAWLSQTELPKNLVFI